MNPRLYKKGDKFLTPSGIIEIKSIARVTKNHGAGYRIGFSIICFPEFEKNVTSGAWKKIKK